MTMPPLRQRPEEKLSGRDFIAPASFWMPEHFVLSAWIEHAPFAFWLVDVHRPRTLVELGTHYGFSYLVFAQAVKRLELATQCFAIDTWKGDEHAGFYGDEVFTELRDYHDPLYSKFSQLLRMTFDEAARHFDDGSVDLLHIDGRHFYDDVKHDFETWKPKLSERGIVLFHDVEVQRREFGVFRLWNELKEQYPHFGFVHGQGLGVLGVGPRVSGLPSALFAASGDAALTEEIREMYARLGGGLQDRWLLGERTSQMERGSAELAQKTAECERLHSELATRTAETQPLREQLARAVAERDAMQAELTRTTAERQRLQGQVSQVTQQTRELQASIANREAELRSITSSTSWKMTGVVRAVGERMPSGAKSRIKSAMRLAWWTVTLRLPGEVRRRAQFRRDKQVVSGSELFDRDWYLAQNPDVAQAGVDPVEHYLLSGSLEGRAPSLQFDGKWYLKQNPDVASAGMNPLVHYVGWGKAEGRLPRPPQSADVTSRGLAIQPQAAPGYAVRASDRRPKIVFVSGNQHAVGHRYRVLNLAESLEADAYRTILIPVEELAKRLGEAEGCDILWLWRTPWSDVIASAMESARRSGARVVFDIDDLLFRPELARSEVIDGIRSMGQSENDARALYEGFRATLMHADHFTTTTVPIARAAEDVGKPTTVIPNGFERGRLELSRAMQLRRQSSDGVVRIGYFSGTLTHQRDLALASRAVAKVLAENPQVRLVLWRETVNLAEFPELEEHAGQIEWRERVPRDETPREYATFDINIAPLEVGNPFCEGKSELKFFEAALVSIPTVASPTQPFATAIRHGETGFLADSDQRWYQLLRDLVQSSELRTSVGNRAYEAVLWQYGPERRKLLMTSLIAQLLAS